MKHRGLIVALKGKKAIVMFENLTYVKINRKPSLRLGEKIIVNKEEELKPTTKYINNSFKYYMPIAIGCLIIFISTIFIMGYKNVESSYISEYATVNVDINPSIEFIIDNNYKVNKVNSLNDSAEILVNEDKFLGLKLEKAFLYYIESLKEDGILKKHKDILLSAALNSNNNDKNELSKTLKNLENRIYDNTNLTIITVNASFKDLKESKGYDMSIGKYVLYKKIKNYNNEFQIDNMSNMTLDEVFKIYTEINDKQKDIEAVSENKPDGYAGSVDTIGGGNSSAITVSSAEEFKSAVSNNNEKVIIVDGRFDLEGDVKIGSNTTLEGIGPNAGLYGGSVKIQDSNYIIKNLTFGPTDGDAMEISGAEKVFVTKCTFYDSSDELCSIVRQADFVTISWCKFYFQEQDSHSEVHLIGNGRDIDAGEGKLNITLHHNWYDKAISSKMTSVRFAKVHLYNNYYNSKDNNYCIGLGEKGYVRLENSVFDNINEAWYDLGEDDNKNFGWKNLIFKKCKQPKFVQNLYPVFELPYSYNMDSVNDVESVVKGGAGNRK